ncbi:MAG: ATP-dependent helicase [Euzebya sp.]
MASNPAAHVTGVLGRGAIVLPGDPSPSGLEHADRVLIDAAVVARPDTVIHRLHRLWVSRTPVVIELGIDPAALQTAERSAEPVHRHDPRFLFPLERLSHLVWANNIDHRSGQGVWWHAVKAERATTGVTAGGPADVTLPDGTPAWVDGGPREPIDLPDPVLHREDTERGILAPQGRRRPAADIADLAPDQAAAVTARRGAVRVAAPAGSGKTRVLTARLQEVLAGRGTPSDAVLALAYNTKAAAELRRRTPGLGGRSATVHSYALRLLRRHLGQLAVLDEHDVRTVLSGLVQPPRLANVDPLQPYIDSLEQVRNALVDPQTIDTERDDVEDLPRVFTAFRDHLRRANAVDFPEMVYRAIELLLGDPDIRRQEQIRVGQVLVDEFQDLTPAYLLFIRLLASPQLQCFGVGDDDQVIYGHAGATPQYLLDFDRLFPGAEDHPLTINYRCPAAVVSAAVDLLGNNATRLAKTILPGPDATATPLEVQRVHTTQQAHAAGAAVSKALGAGATPTDIVVLARIRVALLGTQADLAQQGIPTRSPIGEWLLARTTVSAALAYLRLATAHHLDGEDLAQILHRPLRPIPGTVRDVLRARRWTAEELDGLIDSAAGGRARKPLQRFVRDIHGLRARAVRQPTTEVLRYIADVIGLADVASSLDSSAGEQITASHIDDLDALLQVADHCPDPALFQDFLTQVVTQPATDGPAVTLSSIHSVKGLEWPHVLIVGAAEGVMPHRLATATALMEEERRVFHVAMTRATTSLTVIAPQTGTSRFVAEMQGQPSLVAPTQAPRPGAGTTAPTPTARKKRGTTARRSGGSAAVRFRAAVGLQVKGSGGLSGTVETISDDGALIRTAHGSLLRLRFGSEVRVDGVFGTLVKP